MKEKATEKKLKGVAYGYAGGLLRVWYDNLLSDIDTVAEEAVTDIPELQGKVDLVADSIRDAAKDIYEHANAYSARKFALIFIGNAEDIPKVLDGMLN